MPTPVSTDPPPRRRIEADCERRGRAVVVADCVRLLRRDPVDPTVILILGGPTARQMFARGPRPDQEHWYRVWAARGLLWTGVGAGAEGRAAVEALRSALADPAWRVREMGRASRSASCCPAAKVVARHVIGDLFDQVAALRDDPVARVRLAATRAVTAIVTAEA
jgi:hypothetical protein